MWAALIWLISGIPNLKTDLAGDLILRKFAHAAEFSILAGLIWRAVPAKTVTRRIVLTVLLSIIYAVSDESHQYFVVGRHGSYLDVLVDLSGILAGVAGGIVQLASPQINKISAYKRAADNYHQDGPTGLQRRQ